MPNKLRIHTSKLAAAILATFIASSAIVLSADEPVITLPALTVLGDPLSSPTNRLPSSLSYRTGADLPQGPALVLNDLLVTVPNLHFAGGTSRPRFFMIRGIGENSQFDREPPASSVGISLDGIDFTGLGSVLGLHDLERVEVLRGPQSITYGASALAGLIVLRSKSPTPETEGSIGASIGDDGVRGFRFVVSGPLQNRDDQWLAYRLSLQRHRQDGFRRNVFLDRDNTNRRREESASLRIDWSPAADWLVETTLLYLQHKNGYDVWSLDNNSFVTRTDEPGRDDLTAFGLGLTLTRSWSGHNSLRYALGWQQSDLDYRFDWDWSNEEDLRREYGPVVFGGIDAMERDRQVFTHDLRWTKGWGSLDLNRFVLGLSQKRFREDQDYFGTLTRYDVRTDAMYGLVRFGMVEDWSLSLGGRLEQTRVIFTEPIPLLRDWRSRDWLPGLQAALEWSPTDTSNFYLGLSRGFKAGSVNLERRIPDGARTYRDESLWNLELGQAWTSRDGTLQSRLSLFHSWRRNIQTETSVQTGDGLSFRFYTDNAASGRNYGGEWEGTWQPSETWHWRAGIGWLEAKFDNYVYIDPADGQSMVDLSGTRQTYAPRWTYSFSGGWNQPPYFVSTTWTGRSASLFHQRNPQSLSGHVVGNLGIGLRQPRFTLTLEIRNLLNKRYDVRGFYFANEPPNYDTPKRWVTQGDPRLLVLSLDVPF